MKDKVVSEAERFLLLGKSWRYLRYLHLREYVSKIANEIGTMCVCGAGQGMAELLVAREFRHINVTLTDSIDQIHGYPNYHRAMDLSWRYGMKNINFSVWDVRIPTKRQFDFICSTEVLGQIEDDDLAAENMRMAAKKYIYCLVPFAGGNKNGKQVRRSGVDEYHGNVGRGYSVGRLEELFPNPVAMAGAYWSEFGRVWRDRMHEMSPEEIEEHRDELVPEAKGDLVDCVPKHFANCEGLKILSALI